MRILCSNWFCHFCCEGHIRAGSEYDVPQAVSRGTLAAHECFGASSRLVTQVPPEINERRDDGCAQYSDTLARDYHVRKVPDVPIPRVSQRLFETLKHWARRSGCTHVSHCCGIELGSVVIVVPGAVRHRSALRSRRARGQSRRKKSRRLCRHGNGKRVAQGDAATGRERGRDKLTVCTPVSVSSSWDAVDGVGAACSADKPVGPELARPACSAANSSSSNYQDRQCRGS